MSNLINRTPLTSSSVSYIQSMDGGVMRLPRCPATSEELRAGGFKPMRVAAWFRAPSWFDQLALFAAGSAPTVIVGGAGSGKDTAAKMYAALSGRPFYSIGLSESTDLSTALIEMSIEGGDTVKRLGPLARAAQGLRIQRNGEEMVVPAVILISDFDRANPRTLETFRNAFEGREGWFAMPDGSVLEVARGTTFILTSNSGVDGDGGSGMISEAIDASIANRLNWISTPHPSEGWMKEVILSTFPRIGARQALTLVKAMNALKAVAEQLQLPFGVSIRDCLRWAEHISILMNAGLSFEEGIKRCVAGSVEATRDEANTNALWGAVDPFVGSKIPRGEGEGNPVDAL